MGADGKTVHFIGGFWGGPVRQARGVGEFGLAPDDDHLYLGWEETLGDVWVMDSLVG